MSRAFRPAMLLCALTILVMACDPVPTGQDASDESTALYHHRPNHGGGGDSGPKGNRPVVVTITGGLVTGPNVTEIAEENKRRMLIDDIGGADLQLVNTHAAAVDELTNPANPICEFRPADGPQEAKELLVAGLLGPRVRGSLNINKFDARGTIGYNSTASGGPWLTLGINTQTGTIEDRAAIDYEGTDPLDASSVRIFRFIAGTGIWRTLTSGQDLICVNQDEFTAVVEPL